MLDYLQPSTDTQIHTKTVDATPDLVAACLATLLYLNPGRWESDELARWQKLIRSKQPPTPNTLRDVLSAAILKATGGKA
jgi:hypothetical protein